MSVSSVQSTSIAGHPPHQDLASKVIEIVSDKYRAEVKAEDRLMDDFGFDSLDLVELTMGLEKQFGIQISDADIAKFEAVNDIIEHIRQKKG